MSAYQESDDQAAEARVIALLNGCDGRARHLRFELSCKSVEEAAFAVGGTPHDFVKNICMVDAMGRAVLGIVEGSDRASVSRTSRLLDRPSLRLAEAQEMRNLSGFAPGGMPSFGFEADYVLDDKLHQTERIVYTGGGSAHSLVRISIGDLLRLNAALVGRIRR